MDRLERLVNLVAALIDTPRPLTRAEIRERIEGYSADPEAFRRNFERDKDLLRQMGFPVVTEAADPAHPEDVGYRIPRELYELADLGLDEAELAALRLAASAVQMEGEWARSVVAALRKLGGAAEGPPGAEPAARVQGLASLTVEETASTVFAAIGDRRRITFRYRGEERMVDPWRLSFHRGHWYLAGFDHGRSGERLYRLDRIDSTVGVTGEEQAFAPPHHAEAGPPPPWRIGDEEEQTARLLVDAEQAAWARQDLGEASASEEMPDGSVVFEVAVTAPAGFRNFVLGYLDHAEILGPPSLRAEMEAWLEQLAGSDAATGSGPDGGR